MSVGLSLKELEARLPELEWKMSSLGQTISTKLLPRGLFRLPAETSPVAFINDIKADLKYLSLHQSEYSGYYLAQRIQQKINVLVALCSLEKKPLTPKNQYLNIITTRQNYVHDLEKEKIALLSQHQAMLERIEQTKEEAFILRLKMELGEIEKRLTLIKETMDRITKW